MNSLFRTGQEQLIYDMRTTGSPPPECCWHQTTVLELAEQSLTARTAHFLLEKRLLVRLVSVFRRSAGPATLYRETIHSICSNQHYNRATFRSLWRQYLQYGFWKVRVLQKHPRQMRLSQFVPPTFVVTLIGSTSLALFTSLGRLLLVLVAGSYILANLVASIWTAQQKGWRHLLLLPAVFATLHLSYGLGFLIGLVRFAPRWCNR